MTSKIEEGPKHIVVSALFSFGTMTGSLFRQHDGNVCNATSIRRLGQALPGLAEAPGRQPIFIPILAAKTWGDANMKLDIVELTRETSSPYDCSYLPGREAQLEYRIIRRLSAESYLHLLQRGWRRFGHDFFRPVCRKCSECRPLRIPVADFKPSKSQRRAIRRNESIRWRVQPPTVTKAHIDLFNAYHRDMAIRKGWSHTSITRAGYHYMFLAGDSGFAREFLYFDDDRLVGVGMVDLVPRASSSVYFFHDPNWRPKAPGVFSLLMELEFAREMKRDFHYLGFWIRDCPSMAYKADYRPHQLLDSFVDDGQAVEWKEPPSPTT